MTVFVADIASYQAGLVPAALRPDCAALMIKCTQGADYVNPDYTAWLAQAKAAGLIAMAYHYIDGSAPAAQATQLDEHIGDASLPVMLDVEAVGLPQALEVADAMASGHLHPRLLYFSRSYWAGHGSPDLASPFAARTLTLINASYPSSAAGAPALLYPGDTAPEWAPYGNLSPGLWQFTDAGLESGQRIDVSAFRGTAAALAALLDTTAPPAPTGPTAAPNWPSLAPDASSAWVTMMQRATMLAGLDPKGVDGHYGPNTGAALKAAQTAFKIQADGVCGPITWGRLRARTLTVQKALAAQKLGAGGTDSQAGPATATEVLAFQHARGLKQDGLVGAHTSAALHITTV